MEVRSRVNMCEESKSKLPSSSASSGAAGSGSTDRAPLRLARAEVLELWRVSVRMLRGQGSPLSYLFIPAVISALWLLVCVFTTRPPAMSLEERLSESYIKVN